MVFSSSWFYKSEQYPQVVNRLSQYLVKMSKDFTTVYCLADFVQWHWFNRWTILIEVVQVVFAHGTALLVLEQEWSLEQKLKGRTIYIADFLKLWLLRNIQKYFGEIFSSQLTLKSGVGMWVGGGREEGEAGGWHWRSMQ